MDRLKCLEAFIEIIDISHRIAELAWKKMSPTAIKAYAEDIIRQAEIIIEEGSK